MRYPRKDLFLCSVVVAIVALIGAGLAIERIITVGVQRDDRIMTPTGRALTPAGSHIEVNDRPLGMVLSPDGNLLAVVTGSNFNPGRCTSST
jgi:hypothetical protein